MIQVEDFTSLPRGMNVPLQGRVDACPQCGKNGIEEHPQCGDAYFLHRQSTNIQADGMAIELLECCTLRGLPS